MDFVVAGLGFGALIVIFGFVIRDLGPLFWTRFAGDGLAPSADDRWRWRGLCFAVSSTLTIAGTFVLVVTVGLVLAGVSDGQGAAGAGAATIVATIVALVRISTFVGDYRDGKISAAPDPAIRTQIQSSLKSDRSGGDSNPLSSVRPVKKAEPVATVAATDPDTTSPAAPPATSVNDEPYDVNRLLPTEFDEHYDPAIAEHGASAQGEAPGDLATADSAAGIADAGEPRPEPAPDSSIASAPPAVEVSKPAGDQVVAKQPAGLFKSPLLADIGVPAPAASSDSGFASTVLADVDKEPEPAADNYQSPLLVDLQSQPGDDTANNETPAGTVDEIASQRDETGSQEMTADTVLDERTLPASQRT